jgi:enoyl-CoA hydratase
MGAFTVTREGAVAVLTHDDGKANTFVADTFRDFSATLSGIAASDATAVLYRGRPNYFSAGLNLKVLPTLDEAGFLDLITAFGTAVLDVFLFGKPVVAEVTGHAIGAGAMMAFAADVRYFHAGVFRFGLNEVPNGMPVPSFGVEVARHAAPIRHHMELITHGRVIPPEVAHQMLLTDVPPGDVSAQAMAHAQALSELPSGVYGVTKRLLRGAAGEHARSVMASEALGFYRAVVGK